MWRESRKPPCRRLAWTNYSNGLEIDPGWCTFQATICSWGVWGQVTGWIQRHGTQAENHSSQPQSLQLSSRTSFAIFKYKNSRRNSATYYYENCSGTLFLFWTIINFNIARLRSTSYFGARLQFLSIRRGANMCFAFVLRPSVAFPWSSFDKIKPIKSLKLRIRQPDLLVKYARTSATAAAERTNPSFN
jgi:hypothetical protein